MICLPDSFNTTHREMIIAAAHRSLPLIGTIEFPRAGGLMSYWFDTVERHVEAASYIDHILKGANPAELPVQQPTKFPLIINRKTAKALGLTVPAERARPCRGGDRVNSSWEGNKVPAVAPRTGSLKNNHLSLIEPTAGQ